MLTTSLIYVEKDGMYLMLHRVRKHEDPNAGKWLGVGGKLEKGETPSECARREMLEETGLTANRLSYRGVVRFESSWTEEMHLFTCESFTGVLTDCSEGVLKWVPKDEIYRLNLWEGDRVFLELLQRDAPFFKLLLKYDGDRLIESRLMP